MMESAINQMDKYDHRRHELSDWLAELELRFQLGGVDTDQSKINWCQLIIGATGSYILAGLEDEASWETAKEALLSRLGLGSMKDEAWAALKNYKRGPKDTVELAVEIEKLAKRLHPHDGEAAERQAMDTFLNILEQPLAAEVRKLGCHTMESVVSAARRIEKVLAEQADPKKELQMQEQIRLLQEGLEDVRSQIARSLATTANPASPAVQPPPPTHHTYQDFAEGAPRRPQGQPPSLCFLCGEEGHLTCKCLTLQRLLRQPTPARLLERPSEPKVAQVGCRVGPPITGQLTLEGIPILGLVDTGASVICMGFDIWRRFSAQWGPLRPFEGTVHGVHGKPLQIAGKTQHLDLQWGEARGRACFIVIVGLESLPCLIGMDIMRPLRVHIDVTNGTATPAQPDPQTVHLNAAQSQPASPPPSRPTTRSSANQNSAPRSELGSPATPGRANENSRLSPPLRRSERLRAATQPINRPTQAAPAHSTHSINMARTYPYSLNYDTCLGPATDPFSFSSVYIEELYSGHQVYIKHVQQIVDLLPRTLDPSSRYSLRAHVTPPGHQKMRDSLRLALWWFLPRDGDFRRAENGLHYYLARQGRRVVLRGGNVTSPLHESRLLWVHDPHLRQTSPVPASHLPASRTNNTVPRINNTVPRSNITVPRSNISVPNTRDKVVCRNYENGPRNGPAPGSASRSSDLSVRAPLDNVSTSASGNNSLPSRVNNCPPVPRNNETDRQTDIQKNMSPRPKKKRINFKRRERRARERREADEAFNHDARQAGQSAGAPSSLSVPDQLTPLGLPHSDPISAMRPAVYPPVTLEGRLSANDNSPFQFDQELGESVGLLAGLYKPAVPDPQHHTWAYTSAATSAKPGPPSPSRNLAAQATGVGLGSFTPFSHAVNDLTSTLR